MIVDLAFNLSSLKGHLQEFEYLEKLTVFQRFIQNVKVIVHFMTVRFHYTQSEIFHD